MFVVTVSGLFSVLAIAVGHILIADLLLLKDVEVLGTLLEDVVREVDDVQLEVVDLVHVFAALHLVIVVQSGDVPDVEALVVLVFLLVRMICLLDPVEIVIVASDVLGDILVVDVLMEFRLEVVALRIFIVSTKPPLPAIISSARQIDSGLLWRSAKCLVDIAFLSMRLHSCRTRGDDSCPRATRFCVTLSGLGPTIVSTILVTAITGPRISS